MFTRTRAVSAAGAALAAAAWIFLGSCSIASAADRMLSVQLGGGLRTYNTQLGLRDASGYLLRAGIGLTERVTLAFEGSISPTTRENTRAVTNVYGMRALARVDLLGGATRPYLIVGGGIADYDFSDAWSYSAGVATLGAGVSRRVGSRTFVALEGGVDTYGVRPVSRDVYGNLTHYGDVTYWGMSVVSLTLGYEF